LKPQHINACEGDGERWEGEGKIEAALLLRVSFLSDFVGTSSSRNLLLRLESLAPTSSFNFKL
jgi:hypothetical protein